MQDVKRIWYVDELEIIRNLSMQRKYAEKSE